MTSALVGSIPTTASRRNVVMSIRSESVEIILELDGELAPILIIRNPDENAPVI
jgi:hypothetical protein